MLKVQPFGGWGDLLREIALLPVVRLKSLGASVLYFHPPRAWSRMHALAGGPDLELAKQVTNRVPVIKWSGERVITKMEKAPARVLRAVIELFHPGLFNPGFVWRTEDDVRLDPGRQHIVIQTHLEGLPTKRWPMENWRAVINEVRDRNPDACIHVLDPVGAALAGESIVVHDRLTFPQAIRLVEQCHLLISVDSWSKYVAGWKNIPQLVIVADQSSDYPQVTASTIWRHSFRGLHKNSNLKLLGLAPESTKQARYTFGPMIALHPQDVLRFLPSTAIRFMKSPGTKTPRNAHSQPAGSFCRPSR